MNRHQQDTRSRGPSRPPPVAILAILLGTILRGLYAYPLTEYPGGADAVGTGLKALRILQGHTPVFYADARLGAFESYIHALSFVLFGVSRASMALAPFLSGVVTLVAFWFLVRSLLGPTLGGVALLFFAFPSATYVFWTYMPLGYAETMLFGTLTLCLAERIRRFGVSGLSTFGFGLASGLGFWNSILVLAFLLPALAWLPWRQRRLTRDNRFLVLTFSGFLIGALPWIAYNVIHPLASLRDNFATRPVSRAHQLISNGIYLATYSLPELVAAIDPEDGPNPPNSVQVLLHPAVLAIHIAAVAFALVSLARWWRNNRSTLAPGWVLLLLVAAANLLFALISQAGEFRGLTARYVLPVYLFVSVALALLVRTVWQRAPFLAAALGVPCLVFNAAGYWLPGTPMRLRFERRARDEERLVRFLDERRIDAVFGDYWAVYSINFLTRERILGVARQPEDDFNHYADRLTPGQRWVLVSHDGSELQAWARNAGIEGSSVFVGPYAVFIPTSPWLEHAPRAFAERIRAAYPTGH